MRIFIKENKYILLGLLGALLNLVADLFLGGYKPLENTTGLFAIDLYGESIYQSDGLLISSALLVFVATPLLGLGCYGLIKRIKEDNKIVKILINIAFMVLLTFGGSMHLLSTIMILIYKWFVSIEAVTMINNFLFIPVIVMFIISALSLMIYIIIKTLMNKSQYPRWSVIFNVIFWALLFMFLGTIIGKNQIGMIIRNACFTLGFSVMFLSHLFIKRKSFIKTDNENKQC